MEERIFISAESLYELFDIELTFEDKLNYEKKNELDFWDIMKLNIPSNKKIEIILTIVEDTSIIKRIVFSIWCNNSKTIINDYPIDDFEYTIGNKIKALKELDSILEMYSIRGNESNILRALLICILDNKDFVILI